MTSKAVYYYSVTGKTEAILDKYKLNNIDIYRMNSIKECDVDFGDYETIIFGSPTYGRGVPPEYYKKILGKLYSLKDKRIGLFGSGNTIYGEELYCGALDVLEEIFKTSNEIIFKYKFEGYPKDSDIETLTKMILEA